MNQSGRASLFEAIDAITITINNNNKRKKGQQNHRFDGVCWTMTSKIGPPLFITPKRAKCGNEKMSTPATSIQEYTERMSFLKKYGSPLVTDGVH